jgi:hypothetical protein
MFHDKREQALRYKALSGCIATSFIYFRRKSRFRESVHYVENMELCEPFTTKVEVFWGLTIP